MDYVDRIRELREDNEKTQKEIAKVLNKSQQGYAHLENRKAKFTVEDIILLCNFYKVSADYILGTLKNEAEIKEARNSSIKYQINGGTFNNTKMK